MKQQLCDRLRQIMPSLSGAQITIGGLPPISLGMAGGETATQRVKTPEKESSFPTDLTSTASDFGASVSASGTKIVYCSSVHSH